VLKNVTILYQIKSTSSHTCRSETWCVEREQMKWRSHSRRRYIKDWR